MIEGRRSNLPCTFGDRGRRRAGRGFWRRSDGATMVEYALLLALVAMVAMSSARALGIGTRDVMAVVTSALAAAGGGGNGNGNAGANGGGNGGGNGNGTGNGGCGTGC